MAWIVILATASKHYLLPVGLFCQKGIVCENGSALAEKSTI